jgi:hypothetical protein
LFRSFLHRDVVYLLPQSETHIDVQADINWHSIFHPGAKLPLAQRRDGTFVEPQPEATDKLEDFQ